MVRSVFLFIVSCNGNVYNVVLNQCLLTHDGGDCVDGGDFVCEERGLPLTVTQEPWGSRH